MGELRIGISGWTYAPWRGVFFPPGLRQADELAYAASQVNSIEINGTFYSLQRPSSFNAWRERTPEGFLFSVKAPRFITHIRRLKEAAAPLANFWASGVLRLEEKLGPILWQLPPSLPYDPERLARFFDQLPRDTEEAARKGRGHDDNLRVRVWLRAGAKRPLRHALEVRHESYRQDSFLELLRRHRIGLVVADTAGRWPLIEEATADFVYVRLHGDEKLYVSGYTPEALDRWAARIRDWRDSGHDIYAYFDNDVKVRAPYDAMALAHRLGVRPEPPPPPAVGVRQEEPRAFWPLVRRKRSGAEAGPARRRGRAGRLSAAIPAR